MKYKILIPFLLIFSVSMLNAQDIISKQNFQQAYQEISSMLEGKQPLDFEKAIFLTENAYRDNAFSYADFKAAVDVHSGIIEQLIRTNDKYDWKLFAKGNMGITPDMEVKVKDRYQKALTNWAIFTYLTDTVTVKLEGQELLHLPYTYSNEDPFGTADWKNSQVSNLLETQKGNCYALVTLFKILSERFNSEASIVTAPQHIYIEHRDPNGNRFNVEVATRSFPDMGSIQTLTYTTREALLNDISMRKLDLKQSVGLSLVYLAKGYEYKNKVQDDEFILACANTALQHDTKNLNALLLKAQVYEQRVMKKQMPSASYEMMLAELYKLGYRQMPDDMKNIILSKIQGTPSTSTPTDKTPNPFEEIGEQARYVTLSNGLFEELHTPQEIVRYGQAIFDTEKSKIVKFLDEDNSSYQVDPVVFALSIDPLTKTYPMLTPYQFASNTPIQAIDLDGLEAFIVHGTNQTESGISLSQATKNQLSRISGHSAKAFNSSFRWDAPLLNKQSGRRIAARELVDHVVKVRQSMLMNGTITEDEHITLIGYSHGGNVSAQAAKMLNDKYGIKVNLITLSTPAYNRGSADNPRGDPENPKGNAGIFQHIQIVHENDDVVDYAGGTETYTNPGTTNYVIKQEDIPIDDGEDSHTEVYKSNLYPKFLEKVKSLKKAPAPSGLDKSNK